MIVRRPRPFLLILAGIAALVLLSTHVAAATTNIASPLPATIRAGHLPEPLVATGPTTAAEDRALAQAVTAYAHRAEPDDFGSLTGFLAAYPRSGWAPAVLANLGILYLHYGYFSRALDAWQKAWETGRNASGVHAKALVDGAVGDLARFDAGLGHNKRLAALFADIDKRPITGSATEAVQAAAEELALSIKPDHGHLFICGPMALRALMLAAGVSERQVGFLRWYHAEANGTSLAELARLADRAGFGYRLVFRKPGQSVPLPAVVHWRVGHFAAIIGQAHGRYRVEDPVVPGQELWVTRRALDAEASGYFLVPAGVGQTAGWRAVGEAEAAAVWGKGSTTGTSPGAPGARDPKANPSCPAGCSCPGGMCGYNIGESTVSLALADNPVGYAPRLGPPAKVQITYNQREDSQPQVFNFFNVSPKWTLNWLSYVTDDPNNAGADVTRYLPGGGAYYYTGYNSATGRFAAQNNDGAILVLASESPIAYRRRLADGSIEVYAQSDGAASYPRNIFLSQVIDPQGNTLTLNYDSEMRLADRCGRPANHLHLRAAGQSAADHRDYRPVRAQRHPGLRYRRPARFDHRRPRPDLELHL